MALISVVIPVYYNADSLPLLMEKLNEISKKVSMDLFEFIFVDDGSGDDSYQILKDIASEDERVRIVKLSRNFGSNPAILAGLNYARGDCAVVISADLQDPPELIPQFVAIWHEGNRVVLGARRKRSDPLLSKLFGMVFNRLFKRFVFREYPPGGFDSMLIDRCVIDIVIKLREKNSYIFGQVMWAGFKREIVYYDREKRKHGYSRWTIGKKIKYFIDAFAAFSYLPLRAGSTLGFALAGLGLLYAVFIIALRLFKGIKVEGWASLTVVLLISSGVQLILIGILGEYLWRTLDETRRRPPYVVESVLNFDIDSNMKSTNTGSIKEL